MTTDASYQLGKLRSFVPGPGADLGEQLDRCPVGPSCFTVIPRCSLLDLVRLWCASVVSAGG